MRKIAIVFALAVVGGTAPAASFGAGYVSTAVLLFAAGLAVFLAACLVSGWLVFEHRVVRRMAGARPAGVSAPVTEAPAHALPAGRLRWVARPAPPERFR